MSPMVDPIPRSPPQPHPSSRTSPDPHHHIQSTIVRTLSQPPSCLFWNRSSSWLPCFLQYFPIGALYVLYTWTEASLVQAGYSHPCSMLLRWYAITWLPSSSYESSSSASAQAYGSLAIRQEGPRPTLDLGRSSTLASNYHSWENTYSLATSPSAIRPPVHPAVAEVVLAGVEPYPT